jgi:predicted Fe-S protein YdhL (DUF1289 family)
MSDANDKTDSPCVAICQLDDDGNYCIGCFRTVDEIAHWVEFDDEAKQQILNELQERRQRLDS